MNDINWLLTVIKFLIRPWPLIRIFHYNNFPLSMQISLCLPENQRL